MFTLFCSLIDLTLRNSHLISTKPVPDMSLSFQTVTCFLQEECPVMILLDALILCGVKMEADVKLG